MIRLSRSVVVIYAVASSVLASAFLLRSSPFCSSSQPFVDLGVPNTGQRAVSRTSRRHLLPLSTNDVPSCIIAYYPNDETLKERLKNVQTEIDSLRKSGIGKFLSDENELAERIILGDTKSAEEGANDVMLGKKAIGEHSSEVDGEYLLKVMENVGERISEAIWELRHEYDELKAEAGVVRSTEEISVVEGEKSLAKTMVSVVSSLNEAYEVIQSVMAALEMNRGLANEATRGELRNRLEAKARDIEEPIKVADSVVQTATQKAVKDQSSVSELKEIGDRMSSVIDVTASLVKKLVDTEGGGNVDTVSVAVDQTAVTTEADAVMVMDEKAFGSVDAVRAAAVAVRESDGDARRSLRAALRSNAEEIEGDRGTAERLAEAIRMDVSNDEGALEAQEDGSKTVDSLIDAVDCAVARTADLVAGNEISSEGGSITETVEIEIEDAEESMSNVREAAEKCEVCNAKAIVEEIVVCKSPKLLMTDEMMTGQSAEVAEVRSDATDVLKEQG